MSALVVAAIIAACIIALFFSVILFWTVLEVIIQRTYLRWHNAYQRDRK